MSLLIAHEAPIDYLDIVADYTDYDYCLVHLCETHPKYLEYFKNTKREVILDNSIFELGTAFDADKFAHYIREIKPTYYIIPDALEDLEKTKSNWNMFTEKYPDLPGLKIGVVQGKNFNEICDCYNFLNGRVDCMAISFDYSFFQTDSVDGNATTLENQCYGRQNLIFNLMSRGVWNSKLPHHLLGCSLAKEFGAYSRIKSIRSVDTSNPVVAAIQGERYLKKIGLNTKSSVKLIEHIDDKYDNDTCHQMINNIQEFALLANEPNYACS